MKLSNDINKKDSALASELKVFQSTERFILLVLPIVKRFENFYRYTLGDRTSPINNYGKYVRKL